MFSSEWKFFSGPSQMIGKHFALKVYLGSRAEDTLWIYVIRCYFSIPKCEPKKWNSKSKTPKRCGLFLLNIGVHIWKCSSIFSPSGFPVGGHPSRFTTRAWLRLHSHRLFGPNWNPCKVQLDAGYRNLVVGVLGGGFNVFFVVFSPEIGEASQFDEQYFFRQIWNHQL